MPWEIPVLVKNFSLEILYCFIYFNFQILRSSLEDKSIPECSVTNKTKFSHRRSGRCTRLVWLTHVLNHFSELDECNVTGTCAVPHPWRIPESPHYVHALLHSERIELTRARREHIITRVLRKQKKIKQTIPRSKCITKQMIKEAWRTYLMSCFQTFNYQID